MTDKTRKEASVVSVATAIALASIALSGGSWVGAIAKDVDNLKEEKTKVEEIQKEVQDISKNMTEVQTTQKFVLQEQAKQDKKLDKILEKLEDMQ